ncbi:Protein of unknown function [Gryllus bimaculatus]|nr:Protein of unknown function [Gryllus bimaculatus]
MEEDCCEIPIVGGVMESMEKRNRSANWTDVEMKALLEEVEPRRDFLKCKKTDVASMKVKIKQWEEIEIAMTSKVPQFARSAKIIADKWSSMKKVARKWASVEKRNCPDSGGSGDGGGALMTGKPWWVERVLKFLKATDVGCHIPSDEDQNSNLTAQEESSRNDVQGDQGNFSENNTDLPGKPVCESFTVDLMPLPPELSQFPPLSPNVAAAAPLCSPPTPTFPPSLPVATSGAPSSSPTTAPVRSTSTRSQCPPPRPLPSSRAQIRRHRHKVDMLAQNCEELTYFKRRYYVMRSKLQEQDKKLQDLKFKWALQDREDELNIRERKLQWEIEERNLKLRREEEIHAAKMKALTCKCRNKK